MKQRIKNYLLRYLLNTIVVDEIMTSDKGILKINGVKVSDDDLRQLKAEVKALRGFKVWGLMTKSTRHIAQDKIFNKSTTFEDVMAGKMMLFCIDTMESIARVIHNQQ